MPPAFVIALLIIELDSPVIVDEPKLDDCFVIYVRWRRLFGHQVVNLSGEKAKNRIVTDVVVQRNLESIGSDFSK